MKKNNPLESNSHFKLNKRKKTSETQCVTNKKGKFATFTTAGSEAPKRYADFWNYKTSVLSNRFPPPANRDLIQVKLPHQHLSHQHNRVWIPKDHASRLTDDSINPQKQFLFTQPHLVTHDNDLQKRKAKTQHFHARSKITNEMTTSKQVAYRTWKIRIKPTPQQKQFLHQTIFAMDHLVQKECMFSLAATRARDSPVKADCAKIFTLGTRKQFQSFKVLHIRDPTYTPGSLTWMSEQQKQFKTETQLKQIRDKEIDELTHAPTWNDIQPILSYQSLGSKLLNPEINTRGARLHPQMFDKSICPYDTRSESVHSVCVAVSCRKQYLTAINQQRVADKQPPLPLNIHLRVKTRRAIDQSVFIKTAKGAPTIAWNDDGFQFWVSKKLGAFVPFHKKDYLRFRERLGHEGSIEMRAVIKYTRPGRYYLCIPYVSPIMATKASLTAAPSSATKVVKSVIALDPGIKTFQAGYDNSGLFMEFGKAAGKRLYRLHHKITTSKSSKTQGRLWHKIRDIRTDMHNKLAHDLTKRYTDVMIPELQVGKMLREKKLAEAVLCQASLLQHARFRMRLLEKGEFTGCRVSTVSEHQTSMACGNCGLLCETLGGNRNYTCSGCSYHFDRDMNASRNIFLKNLTDVCGHICDAV